MTKVVLRRWRLSECSKGFFKEWKNNNEVEINENHSFEELSLFMTSRPNYQCETVFFGLVKPVVVS